MGKKNNDLQDLETTMPPSFIDGMKNPQPKTEDKMDDGVCPIPKTKKSKKTRKILRRFKKSSKPGIFFMVFEEDYKEVLSNILQYAWKKDCRLAKIQEFSIVEVEALDDDTMSPGTFILFDRIPFGKEFMNL